MVSRYSTGRQWLFIGIALLCMLGLSSCATSNNNPNVNNEYAKYFTGKEGIETQFSNFPSRLYYYGPDDNSGNEFSFGVEVQNKGASFSRGGIYLSGFDPRLFHFREIPIEGGAAGACGISISSIGFGELGGILRCDGVEVGVGGQHQTLSIDSWAQLMRGLNERFGKSWFVPEKFDFGFDYGHNANGPDSFIINFRNPEGHIEYYQHGRAFIAAFIGLDFTKNFGRDFLLAGDTYEYPGGEFEYLTYNGRVVDWPAGLDQTTQQFLLTSCYQYTTFADPIVCVDPDPISENRKVCTPQSRSFGSNGAPVAITSIEQENTPKKIIFRINVKNIGGGTVYDAGKLEKCSPYYPGRVTAEDLNIVYLGDVRIGQVGLSTRAGRGGMTCFPEVIRLDPRTGAGSTTCTYPIEFTNLKSAYQTPLVVELWYGYSKVLQRSVSIKRVV